MNATSPMRLRPRAIALVLLLVLGALAGCTTNAGEVDLGNDTLVPTPEDPGVPPDETQPPPMVEPAVAKALAVEYAVIRELIPEDVKNATDNGTREDAGNTTGNATGNTTGTVAVDVLDVLANITQIAGEYPNMPTDPRCFRGFVGTDVEPFDDLDKDGLLNVEESWWATDQLDPDSNGNGLTDGEDVYGVDRVYPFKDLGVLAGKDPDRDGLPDLAEICAVGTDPRSKSTDGDRYSDGVEHFRLAFDPYETNPTSYDTSDDLPSYVKGGPLQPDVPDIAFVVTKPTLLLNKALTVAKTKTLKEAYTEEISSVHTKSRVMEGGVKGSLVFGAGYSLSTEATASANPWHANNKVTSSASLSVNLTIEAYGGVSWSDVSTTSTGTHFAGLSAEEWAQTEITNFEKSTLAASMIIRNVGTDLLLSNLTAQVNFRFADEGTSIGSWKLTEGSEYQNLAPGAEVEIPDVTFDLNLDQFRKFARGVPILAEVEYYSFGEDQRRLKDAEGRFVSVDVDWGDGRLERHHVIVGTRGATLKAVVGDFARIETRDDNGTTLIAGINGLDVQYERKAPYSMWAVSFEEGAGNPGIDPKLGADARVYGGDRVVLRYGVDTDGDGLTDNFERILRTKHDAKDTDGDGLTDGEEVGGFAVVGSNGKSVRVETNPRVKDTDGDGMDDKDDPQPAVRFQDNAELLTVRTKLFRNDLCRFTPVLDPSRTTEREDCGRKPDKPLFGVSLQAPIDGFVTGDLDGDGHDDVVGYQKGGEEEKCRTRRSMAGDYTDHWHYCWDAECHVRSGIDGTDLMDPKICGRLLAKESYRTYRPYEPDKDLSARYDRNMSGMMMAIGNVDEDARDEELVTANADDGHCTVWGYDKAKKDLVEQQRFRCGFEPEHVVATGDFETDKFGKEEVLVTHDNRGLCSIHNGNNGLEIGKFECGYKKGWALAVGDVQGDSFDEVISVQTHNPPTCRVGGLGVDVLQFSCGENPAWNQGSVAIGSIVPGGKEELIIMERARWQCVPHEFEGEGKPTELLSHIACLPPLYSDGQAGDILGIAYGNFLRDPD